MTVIGRVAERLAPLPPATTRKVTVERDLRIPMDDGVTLIADHWAPSPQNGTRLEQIPVVLVRTAYGRGAPLGWLYGPALAERGVQALIVSSRGTFGSGGEFLAMRDEREDGLSTLRWLAEQPWAQAGVILAGSSYFGYTQWAVADVAPPIVKAMVPHITSSRLALGLNQPGRFELETIVGFSWNTAPQRRGNRPLPASQERRTYLLRALVGADRRHVDRALNTLPLRDVDAALLGRESQLYQEMLEYRQGDPYWKDTDRSDNVSDVQIPVSLVGGWYDLFLVDQLRDYANLAAVGRAPRLTIGPWWHADPRGMAASVTETVGWAAAVARGEEPETRSPVRLFVMGIEEWRDFDQWPPSGYRHQPWYLLPGGELGPTVAEAVEPTPLVYDPADPTPSLGGPKLNPAGAGPVDNRPLEARRDVLTFTSPALDTDLEVIGNVLAETWVRTDRPDGDVFIRLCDVDERGRSVNLCDELVHFTANDIAKVTLQLSPTAHVFKAGHRIRVQVSGGAFPRFARNLGGGEPPATATTPHKAHIEVFHDTEHTSAVFLPVSRFSA